MIFPETIHSSSEKYTKLFTVTAFFFGIALPTSTFLMQVALVLIVVCIFFDRNLYAFNMLIKNPLVWLPALSFLLLVISLYFQPHEYGMTMVRKFRHLLYALPLALFFYFNPKLIYVFIRGFLISNAVILLISLISGIFNVRIGTVVPDNPAVFRFHITQNFFMALSALCWLVMAWKNTGWKRWVFVFLVILASYDILFLVISRTGYVALLVGVCVWLFLWLGIRQRIVLLIGTVVICILLLTIPNKAAERMWLGVNEIKTCMTNSDGDKYSSCFSSMGLRTVFFLKSIKMIKEHPVLGNGVGAFYYSDPENGYEINNPHNQYLLETVNSGFIGLFIYLFWMFYCYRFALTQHGYIRNIVLAVLTSYMVCNLFNSFILDSGEGTLFMTIVAMFAATTIREKSKCNPTY